VLVPAALQPRPPQVRLHRWATFRRLARIAIAGSAAA
jgi:hypothetical protein